MVIDLVGGGLHREIGPQTIIQEMVIDSEEGGLQMKVMLEESHLKNFIGFSRKTKRAARSSTKMCYQSFTDGRP